MFFIEYNLLFESILVSVNRSGLGGYLLRLFDFHTRQKRSLRSGTFYV